MIAVIIILFLAIYIAFFFPLEPRPKKEPEKSEKYTAQMDKLWRVAQDSMKDRKPFRAEKALLTILKFDEKNAAAYNRLGILYAKQQKYDEAVECFEIAQSLDNNPASIHNVGLIYLETGEYEKAEMAFKQAIELEGDVPARFMALAKAEEKLGNTKKAISALENAYELSPSVATLRQILAIYENSGDTEAATLTAARIEERIIEETKLKNAKSIARANAKATKTAARAAREKAKADAKVARNNAKTADAEKRKRAEEAHLKAEKAKAAARLEAKNAERAARAAAMNARAARKTAATSSVRPVNRTGNGKNPVKRRKIQ